MVWLEAVEELSCIVIVDEAVIAPSIMLPQVLQRRPIIDEGRFCFGATMGSFHLIDYKTVLTMPAI